MVQRSGCKVQRTSISASRNRMQQQHATPTTTTTDQLRISTGAGGFGHTLRAGKELELCALAVVVTGSNLRCWCFSLSHWHKDFPCTRGDFTHCNLCQWCFFFHPQAQIANLHSGNLHCVVVVFGGGGGGGRCMCMWRWWLYLTGGSGG